MKMSRVIVTIIIIATVVLQSSLQSDVFLGGFIVSGLFDRVLVPVI